MSALRPFLGKVFDVGCTVDIENSFDSCHAHVELDGNIDYSGFGPVAGFFPSTPGVASIGLPAQAAVGYGFQVGQNTTVELGGTEAAKLHLGHRTYSQTGTPGLSLGETRSSCAILDRSFSFLSC